jgi:hypothetical protein
MHFCPVHDVIWEFLEDHMRVGIRDVQPMHLGQGLVRFVHIFDRDGLINSSPHQFGDVQISLVRHDRGHNWRALNFNMECWIMLMGFPLYYWNSADIQSAIASFGRLILWENERDHLARILVRARVTALEDVPYFIVITDGEALGFHG